MPRMFGATGVLPGNNAIQGTGNFIYLAAGQVWLPPAGTWQFYSVGGQSIIQVYDPISGQWRPGAGGAANVTKFVQTTNQYVRIANVTGVPVSSATVTAGSGYVTPPVVTASAGGSVWVAIVGGTITALTVVNGGSGYLYPPVVLLDAPPGVAAGANGIMATASATLTAGAVSALTVQNAGAGYTSVPQVYIIPDMRDQAGGGAIASATVGGAGTVTGVVVTDHGLSQGTTPTLAFSGGGGGSGAAATATAIVAAAADTIFIAQM